MHCIVIRPVLTTAKSLFLGHMQYPQSVLKRLPFVILRSQGVRSSTFLKSYECQAMPVVSDHIPFIELNCDG